jgi:uracil-DNA glycosylase
VPHWPNCSRVNRLDEPLAAVLERAPSSWSTLVGAWRRSAAGLALEAFVARRQSAGATIYPAEVLQALHMTPRERVRVVIVGQDPYHGAGQAEGLAFSVPRGTPVPPSLRNIFKEQRRDLGLALPTHGHLGAWAIQGVLLINTVLSVEDGQPGAHAGHGWEALTDEIIKDLSSDRVPKVFMLWGAKARAKAVVARSHGCHAVLESNHPSPLSAARGPQPFLGCGHFGAANRFLEGCGGAPVDWSLA